MTRRRRRGPITHRPSRGTVPTNLSTLKWRSPRRPKPRVSCSGGPKKKPHSLWSHCSKHLAQCTPVSEVTAPFAACRVSRTVFSSRQRCPSRPLAPEAAKSRQDISVRCACACTRGCQMAGIESVIAYALRALTPIVGVCCSTRLDAPPPSHNAGRR